MNTAPNLRNILILFAVLASNMYGQSVSSLASRVAETPRLVDSINTFKGDNSSAILDRLRMEVSNQKDSKGYVIVYCGKICRYGEVEAHLRRIALSLRFKGVPANSFKVIVGGYKDKATTEFWISPQNACTPPIDSSIGIREVKFTGRFRKTVVDYECCY